MMKMVKETVNWPVVHSILLYTLHLTLDKTPYRPIIWVEVMYETS